MLIYIYIYRLTGWKRINCLKAGINIFNLKIKNVNGDPKLIFIISTGQFNRKNLLGATCIKSPPAISLASGYIDRDLNA
jgi:hypothetical protein